MRRVCEHPYAPQILVPLDAPAWTVEVLVRHLSVVDTLWLAVGRSGPEIFAVSAATEAEARAKADAEIVARIHCSPAFSQFGA